MPAMRRKDRSGPGIRNSAEGATGPSPGGELAAAWGGFERGELTKSAATADKQPLEQTEATTRLERQRGSFTAGLLLEPAKPDTSRSASRRAGIEIHPQNRPLTIIEFVLP